MRSSYKPEDVEILLKDITGLVEPLPASVREKQIQKGIHYCEMLPLEYRPSQAYMEAYYSALSHYKKAVASAVCRLGDTLLQQKGRSLVIVSLARAGIPVGILLKRYLCRYYSADIHHYAVSIIRGRGIDRNAMDYILSGHAPESLQFVDGWIGKGAILSQLREALRDYPGVSASLAVLSDPAGLTELCGTHEDILIPSSCLNATVTGLLSRTFLRPDIIGEKDFHGAAFYENLSEEDLSEEFIETIEACFGECREEIRQAGVSGHPEGGIKTKQIGTEVVENIAKAYEIEDINFIKPGIGEATRVLLRRVPWRILIHPAYTGKDELKHITELAGEKNVPCEISKVPLGNYKVCGIIKKLADL